MLSRKKVTYAVFALLSIVAISYIVFARELSGPNLIDAAFFPTVLGILLLALCVIGVVLQIRDPDTSIPFPNFPKVLVSLAITIAFIIAWSLTGMFYIPTFFYLFALFTYYGKTPGWRRVLLDAAIAAGGTVFIYLLFGSLLGVQF